MAVQEWVAGRKQPSEPNNVNLMSLGWKKATGPRVFGPGQGFEMYCKTQVLKLESESESPGLAQRL